LPVLSVKLPADDPSLEASLLEESMASASSTGDVDAVWLILYPKFLLSLSEVRVSSLDSRDLR